MVQPGDLGHAPQQTLANALARRFGGYSHDFFVARYRERDFVIILPDWVSAETLVRRHLITLDEIWLRCYSWGPYWNARPHQTSFAAWIQLRNVPFECWTSARIASMVSSFERFIRADDTSKNMTDLRAYRCRIAVDDIGEIPQRLTIVLGDEVLDIAVHMESSERVRDGGGDDPPPPAPSGPNGGRRDSDPRESLREYGRGGVGEGGGADDTELDRWSVISVNYGARGARRVGGDVGDPRPVEAGLMESCLRWAVKRAEGDGTTEVRNGGLGCPCLPHTAGERADDGVRHGGAGRHRPGDGMSIPRRHVGRDAGETDGGLGRGETVPWGAGTTAEGVSPTACRKGMAGLPRLVWSWQWTRGWASNSQGRMNVWLRVAAEGGRLGSGLALLRVKEELMLGAATRLIIIRWHVRMSKATEN